MILIATKRKLIRSHNIDYVNIMSLLIRKSYLKPVDCLNRISSTKYWIYFLRNPNYPSAYTDTSGISFTIQKCDPSKNYDKLSRML